MREKVSVLQGFRPNEANAIDYRRAEGHFLAPHCDVSLRLHIVCDRLPRERTCLKGRGCRRQDRRLSGTVLVNLSLAGDARMRYTEDKAFLRQRAQAAAGGAQPVVGPPSVLVQLPRRSLQVQSGRVRYNFRHGIAREDLLAERRVSITFRQNRFDGFNV